MRGACCYSPEAQQTLQCTHWAGSGGLKYNFLSHGIPLSLLCLPWLVLQLCLCNWRRSGDSWEVTPGCTRDSHPAWQQKQVGSISRKGREILLLILHQSSPTRQPLPATPARLPPPCPVTPTSNPFLGLSVCITWFTEPLQHNLALDHKWEWRFYEEQCLGSF